MSRKSKPPEVISVTDQEAKELKKGIEESNLSPHQKKILLAILNIYSWLSALYYAKKLNINKIKRLFGFQSEKSPKDEEKKTEPSGKKGSSTKPSSKESSKDKKQGHGKNGKEEFSGAQHHYHELGELQTGDGCPACDRGKLYPVSPGTYIHFVGNPPIQATIHETQKLRCNACLTYFEASLDKELKQRYHPSSDVSIALQHYSLGLPFYRLGQWQSSLGVPLPPIMEKLRRWGLKNLYLKKIEPNEELGKALKYFFKHYPELTLYLRVPGVPLDNNITERLLKVPILNRKNSYFYKTEFGALVGDIVMSLTQTCKAAGKNPFKYLVSLHENKDEVKKAPSQWLPWNYEQTLDLVGI